MAPFFLLVFSFPPPPQEVHQWESRLNSDSYQVREQAEKELRETKSLELLRRLHHSCYPEVRHRSRDHYDTLRYNTLADLGNPPCLDALWYDIKSHSYHDNMRACKEYDGYIQPALRRGGCFNNGWWVGFNDCDHQDRCYSQATHLWASDLVDMGVPVCYIEKVYQEMRKRDEDSKTSHNWWSKR